MLDSMRKALVAQLASYALLPLGRRHMPARLPSLNAIVQAELGNARLARCCEGPVARTDGAGALWVGGATTMHTR